MRNLPPDKYNVAWFKLAECVSRGEKERALGVYRLLAHSLNDSAFARQLQGDILVAFNDVSGALEHYKIAAKLYQQDERFLEAAAIFEHLVTLVPDKKEYLITLIELYILMGNVQKTTSHAYTLSALLIAHNQYDEAIALVESLESKIPTTELGMLGQQMIVAMVSQTNIPIERMVSHIKPVVDHLIASDDVQALQRFLVTLQPLNEECYLQVCSYIESSK